MRIKQITLENFRCFDEKTFDLHKRFTLIVGDNGAGKSAILDALAVGAGSFFLGISEAVSRRIQKDEQRIILKRTTEIPTRELAGETRILCVGIMSGSYSNAQPDDWALAWERTLKGSKGRTTTRWAKNLKDYVEYQAASVRTHESDSPVILPLIAYYGTGRLWGPKRSTGTTPPGSRFDGYKKCLDPASDEDRCFAWWKTQAIAEIQQNKNFSVLNALRNSIVASVDGAESARYDVQLDEVVVEINGESIPFHLLSDGYRNIIGMASDIAYRMILLNPHLNGEVLNKTPGIVLIDEIDLHLHPKWQRRVIEDLMKVFPAVQFVATTHSPFIIQSLPPDQENVGMINLDDPARCDLRERSIEDISEEIQDVEVPQRSKHYIEMMKAAEDYYQMLEGKNKSKDVAFSANEESQLTDLKKTLDEKMERFGNNPAAQALLRLKRLSSGNS